MVTPEGKLFNANNRMPLYPVAGKITNKGKSYSVEELVKMAYGIAEEIIQPAKSLENKELPVQSPEISTRDKQSARNQGESNYRFKGYYIINGVKYPSARLASKITGQSPQTIINLCKSGKKGYSFESI